MIVSPQYIFSYWIFTWFLIYEVGWTKYNPFLLLCIGLIANVLTVFSMMYYRNDWVSILVYCFINTFLKVIPVFLLWGSKIKSRDFYASIGLFVIYLLFVYVNNKMDIYFQVVESIQKNQPITPFTGTVKKMLKKW
jgi:hypothetical protein